MPTFELPFITLKSDKTIFEIQFDKNSGIRLPYPVCQPNLRPNLLTYGERIYRFQ